MMKDTTLDKRREAFMELFDDMNWLESFHAHNYDGETTLVDIVTYKEDSITFIWLYDSKAVIIQAITNGELKVNGTFSRREDLDKIYKVIADIAKNYFN